ncbi:DUF2391 family protein [Natronomonas halophila]|uniref:DUF2391 family protein n=1 Tax=Natronomonas halophila TaxID=2747817 RepID=UPI0015B507AC|nr:DUF2391 family protein [Natronomonas halophila]QLD84582.1 DUF2391 family protein [Natronomonas halophila]
MSDTTAPRDPDGVAVEDVLNQLEELEETVDDEAEREEVRRAMRLVDSLSPEGVRGTIDKFTRRDIAEAFVGAILISLPMLVEDGVNAIAEHLLAAPALLVINVSFVVIMTAGMLYYAEFREVEVSRPLFGLIPRRLLAVLVIAFITAAFTMTVWGRLDGWADPVVALGRVSVVWAVACFGAALGDILPGESSGTDINDEIDEFGERLGIGDEEGLF